MMLFEEHPALAGTSRVGTIAEPGQRVSSGEIAALVILGVSAACWSAFIRMPLRIPGSSLMSAVLPIALGFAVVPRQFAGTTMSTSAAVAASLMTVTGANHFGVGAMTSLLAMGPLLDLALARARRGWRLYLAFVSAGLAANVLAFSLRGGSKLLGLEAPGLRPFQDWLSQAAVTYVLAGGFAGLLSAACWLRIRRE